MNHKICTKLLSAAALAAALNITSFEAQAADGRALELMKIERTIVVAHRGFSMGAPENTVPAFQWGKLACADLVELDFYVNKDGTLFCHHDSKMDRTTDIRSSLNLTNVAMIDLTDEQVRKLDAGKWKSPLFAGTPTPSLEEALIVIQADGVHDAGRAQDRFSRAMRRRVEKLDCVNDLIVQSFNWNFLADMNKVRPSRSPSPWDLKTSCVG